MFTLYLQIGLIYFIIGIGVALISYFILKKRTFGKFVGTLIIALIGSYLGGVFEFYFQDIIHYLTNLNNAVNVFPPIITSIVLLWIYTKIFSHRIDED